MDFLDFEDNRIADIVAEADNGVVAPADAVTQILDEEEMLSELRTSADLGRFFAQHAFLLLQAALARLLQDEIAFANREAIVALFGDLEKVYDHVSLLLVSKIATSL